MVTTSNQTPLQGSGSQTSGVMITTSNQIPLQGNGNQTSGVTGTNSNQTPTPGSETQTSGVMVTTSNQTPPQGSGTQTSGVTGTNSNQTPTPGSETQTGGDTRLHTTTRGYRTLLLTPLQVCSPVVEVKSFLRLETCCRGQCTCGCTLSSVSCSRRIIQRSFLWY